MSVTNEFMVRLFLSDFVTTAERLALIATDFFGVATETTFSGIPVLEINWTFPEGMTRAEQICAIGAYKLRIRDFRR